MRKGGWGGGRGLTVPTSSYVKVSYKDAGINFIRAGGASRELEQDSGERAQGGARKSRRSAVCAEGVRQRDSEGFRSEMETRRPPKHTLRNDFARDTALGLGTPPSTRVDPRGTN